MPEITTGSSRPRVATCAAGGTARWRSGASPSMFHPAYWKRPNSSIVCSTRWTDTGFPAATLSEVTENTFIGDRGSVAECLSARFPPRGFASRSTTSARQYSSLSYLRHLPINTLKIDQSFVREIRIGRRCFANRVRHHRYCRRTRTTWSPKALRPRSGRSSCTGLGATKCRASCSAGRFPSPHCAKRWRHRSTGWYGAPENFLFCRLPRYRQRISRLIDHEQ